MTLHKPWNVIKICVMTRVTSDKNLYSKEYLYGLFFRTYLISVKIQI